MSMSQTGLFPKIEPYSMGKLKVSDLHTIVYEEVGNPKGRPAVYLHGGPGIGILPGYRRFFDPTFYRTILPDQRGAGRSTPNAELRENTTWDLIEDLERLRRHLDIGPWIVFGGSWGSTLALCYAITHPQSVSALILRGVWLVRPFELTWLFEAGGASLVFPDEWDRFRAPVEAIGVESTLQGYHQLLTGAEEAARLAAAKSWSRWEGSMATLIRDEAALIAIETDKQVLSKARIECHYATNNAFLDGDNFILENTPKIAHVPCRIVQGRHDIICPTISAWELHKALPKSDLRIIADGSHSPMDPGMAAQLVQATEDFRSI
jgi:proline iminopeptidase